jgi:hypothetical protein
MIVIADTGPLNYLVLIGEVEVLKPLYRLDPELERLVRHCISMEKRS